MTEPFAPAQFRDFDDADKLSQPAYSPLDSGIELAPAGKALTGRALTRIVRYDLYIVDTTLQPPKLQRFFVYPFALFLALARRLERRLQPALRAQEKLKKPYADVVTVSTETYAVVTSRTTRSRTRTPEPSPATPPRATTSTQGGRRSVPGRGPPGAAGATRYTA